MVFHKNEKGKFVEITCEIPAGRMIADVEYGVYGIPENAGKGGGFRVVRGTRFRDARSVRDFENTISKS